MNPAINPSCRNRPGASQTLAVMLPVGVGFSQGSLSPEAALALSKLLLQPDMFPEARQHLTRTLFDYYKSLLAREPMQIPTVRRMW